MRNLRPAAALAALVAGYGLAGAPVAKAVEFSFLTGAGCQLSIPTTDTKFRPKAIGARNESSTTSSFVVCPLPVTGASSNDYFQQVQVALYSLGGISRSVTCTAVSGWYFPGSDVDAKYSSKSAAVAGSGVSAVLLWRAPDFGEGNDGDPIKSSTGFSITCNLPPQTAISYISGLDA
jgi:hypothetical protein